MKWLKNKIKEWRSLRVISSIKTAPGDIVIDCGANVGNITAVLARQGATVYAFEPNPYAFEVLSKRFLCKYNVHCYQKAVGIKNGKEKLYLHKDTRIDPVKYSTGSSLLSYKNNVSVSEYAIVRVIDFCEFIERFQRRIKILKMDIEGAECDVLQKMIDRGLIDRIDYMFVEKHDKKIPSLRERIAGIERMKLPNVNLNWS